MNANRSTCAFLIACAASIATAQTAVAAPDFGQLKGLMGGGSSPSSLSSLSSANLGNAAGIIEYCTKNNYLNGDSATSVKDQVLKKLGKNDSANDAKAVTGSNDYLSGLKGQLNTSDGKKVDLGSPGIKETITKKVCDTVLNQAKSFL